MSACPNCSSEVPAGDRFCGTCGTVIESGCPSCGETIRPETCSAASAAPRLAERRPRRSARGSRTTRDRAPTGVGAVRRPRRLHAASESRDAEETRELLSRYFDTCRRLIELYGGTVEKFIGDAVMAVWGTPTATEDDAERAVRAALDLVASVSSLGDEIGAPELRARAGVLTGEAAVTLGAEGEGMVAGDLVNTASRVQSVAEPGTVFVGESTRRATEQAIAYEDAGHVRAQGQGRADAALARAARRLRRARHAQVGRSRGPVRRP